MYSVPLYRCQLCQAVLPCYALRAARMQRGQGERLLQITNDLMLQMSGVFWLVKGPLLRPCT